MPSSAGQTSFIGSMVSIDCGPLGSYQGHVKRIDPEMNTLTITHAFHNGLPCEEPQINLSSTTILDIKIIHSPLEAKAIIDRKVTPSKMTKEIDDVTKPTCISPVKIIKATSKRSGKSSEERLMANDRFPSDGSSPLKCGSSTRKLSPHGLGSISKFEETTNTESSSNNAFTKIMDFNGSYQDGAQANSFLEETNCRSKVKHRETSPKKILKSNKRSTNSKNMECFSAPADSFLQDFDFESNLKLFNKKAVFQEIEHKFPDLSFEPDAREPKYRHDENVLGNDSSNQHVSIKQQIHVPESDGQLYYTDSGLVLPTVSIQLRDKLCEAAANAGLTLERQTESFGRAASEIIIQLIGGYHRIQPTNDHQMPVVVFLCGAHNQGALGLCTARILACHNIQVHVLFPNFTNVPEGVSKELNLYQLSCGTLVHSVKHLPTTIDLIVSALDSPNDSATCHQPWYKAILNWNISTDIRSPFLALDPPPHGPGIQAKWSLCKVLPLKESSSKCGSLYLCDLGIPSRIFSQQGIKYTSPFGAKFVIPLHSSI